MVILMIQGKISILPSSAQAQAPAGLSITLIPSSTPTHPPEFGQIQARTQPIRTSIEKVAYDFFLTCSLLVHYWFFTSSLLFHTLFVTCA